MSGLRGQIQACSKCDLCKNMTVSPVAIEYFGNTPLDVLIIVGTSVKQHNDLWQDVISGPEKEMLKKIFNGLNLKFAITFLVKCIKENNRYAKKDVLTCDWNIKEIGATKPKFIIGMGKLDYSPVIFDIITSSPFTVFSSKKSTEQFIQQIEKLIK